MSLRTRLGLTVLLIAVPLLIGLSWVRSELLLRQIETGMRSYVLAHMDDDERTGCEASPESYSGERGRRPQSRRPPAPPPPPGADHLPGEADAPTDDASDANAPDDPETSGRDARPPRDGPEDRAGRRGGRRARPGRGRPGRHRGAEGDRRGRGPGRGGSFAPRPRLFAYSSAFVSFNPDAPEFPASIREELESGEDIATAPGVDPKGQKLFHVGVRLPPLEGGLDDSPCAIVLVSRPDPRAHFELDFLMWGALGLCATMLCAVLLAAGPIVRRIRLLTTEVRAAAADHYATPVGADASDEIGELGRAFNEAGAELRSHIDTLAEREQTLRAFLSNTTHDVMIPLTVLQGHLSALRDSVSADGDASGDFVCDAGRVRSALEESHYIGSLLHNLAAAAKLQAGEASFHLFAVNLGDLVERVAHRHAPIARQSGIELDFAVPEAPATTLADVTLLEQAVSNLVHNAVRYNEDGGHVAVSLETQGDQFILRVIDDGPGIPAADLAHVTKPRFRSDAARTRDPAGQGLGLHIAGDVAARHGFDLRITTREPHGVEATLAGTLCTSAPDAG